MATLMFRLCFSALVLSLGLFWVQKAPAAALPVLNPDFTIDPSSDSLANGEANPVALGWTATGFATEFGQFDFSFNGSSQINPAQYPNGLGNSNGQRAFIRHFSNFTNFRTVDITSDVFDADPLSGSTTIRPNSVYELTVAVGNRIDTPFPNQFSNISFRDSNGNVYAQQFLTPNSGGVAPDEGSFRDYTISFEVDELGNFAGVSSDDPGFSSDFNVGDSVVGGDLVIRLTGQTNATGSPMDIEFSNVRASITSTDTPPRVIPEPASVALLGFGAAVLGATRRRK